MDEDDDAIQVYDFGDFSVGFNVKDALEFVDVHSTDIDPGLRGLHLGQKVEDAITILGKPVPTQRMCFLTNHKVLF